jgi:hypothetical protein
LGINPSTICRRDERNYDCKWLIDGLVTAKIIKDDNIDVIGRPEVIPEYNKENPRVEVEIWNAS